VTHGPTILGLFPRFNAIDDKKYGSTEEFNDEYGVTEIYIELTHLNITQIAEQ